MNLKYFPQKRWLIRTQFLNIHVANECECDLTIEFNE